tara:strand:+ start:140 stop:442 length:303 start_codon:yes stop_codon:yes gene_type:complete
MNRIFAIMLVVLFSSNVFAEGEMTEQDYIDEAKEKASLVLVSKFYLQNGKHGYHLYALEGRWVVGALEARASELCGNKGYIKKLDEVTGGTRRYIIQCNE